MKVLLIGVNEGAPLGLAYIAAYLKKHGKEVILIDAASLCMTPEALNEQIRKIKPDILGATLFTFSLAQGFSIFEMAKKTNSSIITVAGGPHPTALPGDTVKNKYVDIVVHGEGEVTMNVLVDHLAGGRDYRQIDGIAFMDGETAVVNKPREMIRDLDTLPFPDLEDLPIEKYGHPVLNRKNIVTIMASRGCPYQCIFCAVANMWGRQVRKRSPGSVVDEMEMLYHSYGARSIRFMDSIFTLDEQWVIETCSLMKQRSIDIEWACSARADSLNEQVLRIMKQAKCKHIAIGVESGDSEMLKRMGKKETLEQIRQAFRQAKQAGILTDATFIIGLPGETKETIKRTTEFARELNPYQVAYSYAVPYPGTELYRIAKEEGKLDNLKWEQFSQYMGPVYVPEGLTEQYIKNAYNRRFFLKKLLRPKSVKEFKVEFVCLISFLIRPMIGRLVPYRLCQRAHLILYHWSRR